MDGIKWVKLSVDFIHSSKVKHIRAQKGGDTMALLWVHLLCRAGIVNDRGRVYVASGVPYTAAGLASEFGMPKKTVADALKLFEQLGMLRQEDGVLVIANWCEHQNVEGMERVRDGASQPAPAKDDSSREVARARSRESSRRYRDRQKGVTDAEQVTMDECHGDGHGDSGDGHGDMPVTVTVTRGDGHGDSGDGHGDMPVTVTVTHGDGHGDRQDTEIKKREEEKEIERRDEDGEPDFQKTLGIDDEYKVSSRARAKSASLLKDAILAQKLLGGHLPKLFDAIEDALTRGVTPNEVMRTAHAAGGDWAHFASALMTPKKEWTTG